MVRDRTETGYMKIAAIVLVVLAGVLGCFSYWGINTIEGQHAYDEMAAIVPYSAGLLAAVFALIAAGLYWWGDRRARL